QAHGRHVATTRTAILPLFKINGRLQGGQKSKTHLELIGVEGWSCTATTLGRPRPRTLVLGRSGSIARKRKPARPSRLRRLGTCVSRSLPRPPRERSRPSNAPVIRGIG